MGFPFSKRKILVVEDSRPLSKAVTVKLKSLGFKVINAATFDEAVKALDKNKKIAAVWIDHWLREKTNGLQVLQYIKEHKDHHGVPTFLVSACGEEWSEKYEALGITKRFIKSDHSMSDIIDEINKAIV